MNFLYSDKFMLIKDSSEILNIYIHSDKKRKKMETLINSNTNYRRDMKLIPMNTDYCLLQFDVLKFFLGVHLHGRFQPNFNFFNVNLQIFRRNREVHFTNCLKTNFHNISNIGLRVI